MGGSFHRDHAESLWVGGEAADRKYVQIGTFVGARQLRFLCDHPEEADVLPDAGSVGSGLDAGASLYVGM